MIGTSARSWLAKKNAQKRREKENKELLFRIKSKGCIICGYNRCSDALHFHHINPKLKHLRAKTFNNILSWGFRKLYAEIGKCVVVCANCHAEIHDNLHPEYIIEDADEAIGKDPQLFFYGFQIDKEE